MPTVPNVKGQPRPTSITQPAPEHDNPPPTPSPAIPVRVPQPPGPEIAPEPAIRVEDFVPPTQEELAARGMAAQVVKKNEMVPSATSTEPEPEGERPLYQFTDADRAAASRARWHKYDWEGTPMDEALTRLAELRAETERGGIILQKRVSEVRVERVKCFGCDNIIDLSTGRWVTYRTRNNFQTGIPETAYACSQACGLKLNRDFNHPSRQPAPAVTR